MAAEHFSKQMFGFSFLLLSVICCSGTSVGLSYDSRSNSLPSFKKLPRISRELLDRTANSTGNESASLTNSSLIGETTPTTPMTAPITTPPTIPITTPTTPGITPSTPTTTTPPSMPTTPMTPTTPTTTPPTTGSSSGSWCVAKSGVADTSLQVALDYACGIGGADCSAIQQGGACYNPDTVAAHASYAFDSYYKKNGMTPGSCDFGGNAQVTTVDPSSGTCTFSTGSGSSVLNTTLPNGGGLGGGSIAPANSSDAAATSIFFCLPIFFTLISLVLSIIIGGQL